MNFSFVKRVFDIIVSIIILLILIVFLPLWIIIALVIAIQTHSFPIYRQQRIGKGGKKFYLYKWKTMKDDAHNLNKYLTQEEIDSFLKEYKLAKDPRIVGIGHFLRKYKIDEFPQFVNVLKGDMSIVGPRPLILEELQSFYTNEQQKLFLSVRPGITGEWTSKYYDMGYENGKRQQAELQYIDYQKTTTTNPIKHDFIIIKDTFIRLLTFSKY